MNDGLRIVLDLRGGVFFWSLTERGERHDSARGYATPSEALQHAEMYRAVLKPIVRGQRLAQQQ